MKLSFVITVNEMWQLQSYWLHPCKVGDQGRSLGKIKFTPTRKIVLKSWKIKEAKRCILTLFETMFWKLELQRNFWK